MASVRKELLANNQFCVTIGKLIYSFSRVTNLSASAEYEPYQEGGCNEFPRLLPKPHMRQDKLILERGVCISASGQGEQELTTGTRVDSVVVMVMKNRHIYKYYYFDEGIVTGWEIGDLDALGQGILIRKLEITHTGLHEGDDLKE